MGKVNSKALAERGNVRLKETRYGLMLYNVHDAFVGRSLDLYGEFSRGEEELFAQILKPGMVVLDVGANIGAHTLYFAGAVGASGQVIAFEPQRIVFQLLCANLALNDIANVRALQMGAGREKGQAFVPTINYAKTGNFGGISLAAEGGEQVRVIRIDDLNLPRCQFVKLDVEGMEKEAIAGAAQTIKQHRPLLYVENDRQEQSAALINALMAMDYSLYWHMPPLFSADNVYGNSKNIFGNILSCNMLCLPSERQQTTTGLKKIADPNEWPLRRNR